MNLVADFIIKYRKTIIAVFIAASIVCAPLAMLVKINYKLADYLPTFVQSTHGIDIQSEQFNDAVPNASVMIKVQDIVEGLQYKSQLEAIEGVTSVIWLDDFVDIKAPLQIASGETVEQFFKDGYALYNLVMTEAAVPKVEELIGSDNALAGEVPALVAMQGAAVAEVLNAFLILIPALLIILILTTTSWLEPLLLLLSMGFSIVLNMGTNIVFGEVSFITNSVSPILQMAVSLDYAIILLHAFEDQRKNGLEPALAMKEAIKIAFSAISASASTTFFGFLALVFMGFLIGADLGVNLAKGIIFSFLCVMVLLPGVTLSIYKVVDKLSHRAFFPSTAGIYKVLNKFAIPTVAIVAIALVPCYLGQARTDFLYGAESAGSGTRAALDLEKIEQQFGDSNIIVVLLPRGDVASELALSRDLLASDKITSVMSYAQTVGSQIPPDFLDASETEPFYSQDFARLLVYADAKTEGDATFSIIQSIITKVQEYYPDGSYVTGRSTILFDMRDVVQADNLKVNLIAIIAIFIVLLITFRSLILPFILLLTIEAAIWINLSLPYFTDSPVNYIGYLVLNTVQLGATVDYAILLTSTYLRFRRSMPKRQAMNSSLGYCFKPILMSASIMATAGFALYSASSNAIVCDIGMLLGRGTLLSAVLVLTFLPALLRLFDPVIGKLTIRSGFM